MITTKEFDKIMPEETLLNSTELERIIRELGIEKYVLILGSMHKNDYDSEYNCYRELIDERINPSWILYEAKEGRDEKPIYYKSPEFVRWIKKHNFRTTSCDLTFNEKKTIKDEIKCDYRIKRPKYESNILRRLYYNEREKRMGENILCCYRKTNKPIIVIIGHEHAGEYSNIHKILKGKTEYITFWKNNKYCKECGIKLNEDDSNTYCSNCDADLYYIMIHKKNINLPFNMQ